jgi:hypothetical protein
MVKIMEEMARFCLTLTPKQKKWLKMKEENENIKPTEYIRRLIDREREKSGEIVM